MSDPRTLADALFDKRGPARFTTGTKFFEGRGYNVIVKRMLTRAQLRKLARDAYAIGASQAREEAEL